MSRINWGYLDQLYGELSSLITDIRIIIWGYKSLYQQIMKNDWNSVSGMCMQCNKIICFHRKYCGLMNRRLREEEFLMCIIIMYGQKEIRMWHEQLLFNINSNAMYGQVCTMIVGPYFLPDRLTSTAFLNFLRNELSYLLEDVPFYSVQNIWMQLDGCPAHYGTQVRQWLDNQFPHRWINRRGPISWPQRSPDLMPLDFYLWGTLKNKVYRTRINSRNELIQKINNAFNEMKQNRNDIYKFNFWSLSIMYCQEQWTFWNGVLINLMVNILIYSSQYSQ